MSIIQESFTQLYPNQEFNYIAQLKYSRKFSPYNANIKLYNNQLTLNISADWRGVDKDIVIGLIQSLMVKVFSRRNKHNKVYTSNIDYYNNFIKKLHLVAPRTESDSDLVEAFHKINEQFFTGIVEAPNLQWGAFTKRKLGHYDFQTDTIIMSSALKEAPQEFIDYVLYHEMLHKKLKYTCTNGRTLHHSTEFKREEAKFPRAQKLEQEIARFVSYKRRPKNSQRKKRFNFFGFFD